jgi:hypothetical protein
MPFMETESSLPCSYVITSEILSCAPFYEYYVLLLTRSCMRIAYSVVGGPRCRRRDNIGKYFKGLRYERVNWIQMTQCGGGGGHI